MRKGKTSFLLWFIVVFLFLAGSAAYSAQTEPLEILRYEKQTSSVSLEMVRLNGRDAIAVAFKGTDDLHYYAKKETAAGGFNLKITPTAPKGVTFGEVIFPKYKNFFDKAQNKNVEVYVGDFTVFIPIQANVLSEPVNVEVKIEGIACTSIVCLAPFEHTLSTAIDYSNHDTWPKIDLKKIPETSTSAETAVQGGSYTVPVALVLAVLTGLMFNIMPCVLPVIPLIITRLLDQASQSKARSIALGLAFCGGILLFFAALAGLNIILQLFYGTVLQWGDPLRNTTFVTSIAILLIVLGLFMFDVFSIGIPSSVTGKAGSGRGAAGSVGMGFLAALLSTPCTFGILAGVFAWAQTQNLILSTLAIMLMGLGMAAPYAVLVSIPGLLSKLPKPGTWMEIVKKAMGFVLLIIAVKLIGALPKDRLVNVLYYAVAVSFCLWMWGGWVNFNTASGKKWTVRVLALLIAVAAGMLLLPKPEKLIDWQDYDPAQIELARQQQKPILIKFTANWCTTCTWVDRRVFQQKDIAELIEQKGVLAVKADTTSADSVATADLANVYKEPGVPVTVLHLPMEPLKKLRGIIDKEQLKEILTALPDKKIDG